MLFNASELTWQEIKLGIEVSNERKYHPMQKFEYNIVRQGKVDNLVPELITISVCISRQELIEELNKVLEELDGERKCVDYLTKYCTSRSSCEGCTFCVKTKYGVECLIKDPKSWTEREAEDTAFSTYYLAQRSVSEKYKL